MATKTVKLINKAGDTLILQTDASQVIYSGTGAGTTIGEAIDALWEVVEALEAQMASASAVKEVTMSNSGTADGVTITTEVTNSDGTTPKGATTIGTATTNQAGLMSAEDKAHFDQMYQDYVDGGFCHCGDGTTTYDDPEITSFSYPNMPAAGGTIYPTYTYKQTYTKSDGTTGEITGGGELKFEEA